MNTTWIVVADAAHARIFTRTGNRGALNEYEDMVHPESRLHDHDLASDRQGRSFDRSKAGARHALEPAIHPKAEAAEVFARDVAAVIEAGRTSGAFDAIVLIAAPHFLGLLRKGLSDPARQLVEAEIAKDLVRHGVDEIAQHVDIKG